MSEFNWVGMIMTVGLISFFTALAGSFKWYTAPLAAIGFIIGTLIVKMVDN